MRSVQTKALAILITLAILALASAPAQAGCGCEKLPPELAQLRPHATSVGERVTLFHPALVPGASYSVTFESGTSAASASVIATAVAKRDLADGEDKPQLIVPLPALPLGPTAVRVASDGAILLELEDAALTVIGAPVVLPQDLGTVFLPDFEAAVSRSGVVYLSLDVSAVTLPRVFEAQLQGYPLRFGQQDVLFYNTQGFLMQRLEEGMPGLFSLEPASAGTHSDILRYSRHEFATYFLKHEERESHEVDPTDLDWHLNGTPHIDHDHLVVGIVGTLDDGSDPLPGATPPFDLVLETSSLFEHGIVGVDRVFLDRDTGADSYSNSTGSYGSQAAVLSNGEIRLTGHATIHGDATAASFDSSSTGGVTGTMSWASTPIEFLPVDVPTGLEPLGDVSVSRGAVLTLGPGSYAASEIVVGRDGILYIDNSTGPVTIYVSGSVTVKNDGQVIPADPNPERFAVYVSGDAPVILSGSGEFRGVVYAPESYVNIGGHGEFFGAFVGGQLKLSGSAWAHYDPALRGAEPTGETGGGAGDGGGGDETPEDPTPTSGPGNKGKKQGKKK